jgi:hypothetical protein
MGYVSTRRDVAERGIQVNPVLPTSKPSGLAWWGAPYARNSVDLVVTGIDRDRRAPERNLSGFSVLSIHICSLRLHFLV